MPNQLLQEALNLIKAGDLIRAKARVFAVLKTEPGNADAWYLTAYLLQGRNKQIQALERVLAIDPNHERARAALSRLQSGQPVDSSRVDEMPPPVIRPVAPMVQSTPPRRSLVSLLIVTILAVALIGTAAVLVMNQVRNTNISSGPVVTLTALAQQSVDAADAAATDTANAGITEVAAVQNTVAAQYQNTLAAAYVTNTQVGVIALQTMTAQAFTPAFTATSIQTGTLATLSPATDVLKAISPLDLQKTAQAPTSTHIQASSTPTPSNTTVPSRTPTKMLTSTPTATVTLTPTNVSSATPTLTVINTSAFATEAATIALTNTESTAASTASATIAASDTSVPSETPTAYSAPISTSAATSAGTLTPGSQDAPIPAKQVYRIPGIGRMNILSSTWTSGQPGLAILKVSFICDLPTTQRCNTSNFLFSAIGDSGVSYDRAFVTGIPDPAFGVIQNSDLPGGSRSTGNIAFQISNPEHKLVLHVSIFQSNQDIYFVIG